MSTAKTRIAAALSVAAAAVLSVGGASATAAGPTLYTETTLNLNSSLASNLSGLLVAAPPNAADGLQRWEAKSFIITLPNGQPRFGWQLKNSTTKKCVSDAGNNVQVKEVTCETAPGSATNQVWQVIDPRTVNSKTYWFWQSATSGRRLQNSSNITPGAFPTFTVIATDKRANPGTALEALQLWNEKVVN
jgi:hypothetical protein